MNEGREKMGGGGRKKGDVRSPFFYMSDLTLHYGFFNWRIWMQIRLGGRH